MLNTNQLDKLKSNWGEKAESMACMAEVRVYDPLSSWECYIYALNPQDEDEISCIIKGFTVEVCDWRLSEMFKHFNSHGEPPEIDVEYRPRRAAELFKYLSELERYDNG